MGAITSQKSKLEISQDGVAWTLVGGKTAVDEIPREWTRLAGEDISSEQEEPIKGILSAPNLNITGNVVPGDAGQDLLDTAFNDEDDSWFFRVTPNRTPNQQAIYILFKAKVFSLSGPGLSTNSLQTFTANLAITNKPTIEDIA